MNLEHIKIEISNPRPSGGQQVGVIPTGVKVTHLPSGLVAICESERSQMRNRNIAMAMIEYGLTEIIGKDSQSTKP